MKRNTLGTLIRIISCWTLFAATSWTQTQPFIFGMNGHPYTQEPYNEATLPQQFTMLKELGVTWYRTDWYPDTPQASIDNLVTVAEQNGITLLPVIFPPVNLDTETDTNQIYLKSLRHAKAIASRYKTKIRMWELDNELDNYCLIRKGEKDINGVVWPWGDPDGDKPEQYEPVRAKKVMALLRGLRDGIKQADPTLKAMFNSAGWLHYGFFAMLMNDNIQFDAIGYHWYSEMGPIINAGGRNINVLAKLSEFKRQIWITEGNRRDGSYPNNRKDESDYIYRALSGFKSLPPSHPLLKAYFIYQLCDQPILGTDNPEAHYGLVTAVKNSSGKWTIGEKKPAYYTARDTIKKLSATQ